MAEKKQVFTTDDGQEFETEGEANTHETLVAAERQYQNARNRFARAVWETQTTADGQRFNFSRWRYYAIKRFCGVPTIEEVSLFAGSCSLDDRDVLDLLQVTQDSRGEIRYRHWRISELYASIAAAETALLGELREHVAYVQEQIDTLDKSLAKDGDNDSDQT